MNEILNFLEGENIKGINYNPRSISSYVANNNKCLEFLRSKKVDIM